MRIEEYGRATFLVTSHGDPFTVDLLALKGNGQCDCLHFKTRLSKEIEQCKQRGTWKPGDHFRCPHIQFARQYLLDKFLGALAKQFPDNKQET